MILSYRASKGGLTMLRFTRKQHLAFTAAGALVVVTSASIPVRADEMVQNLGPVGPHEPVLAAVGLKRVVAFYLPYSSSCAVHAVIWNNDMHPDGLIAKFWPHVGDSAQRVRVSLKPGQIAHIDSNDNVSLALQCGDNGKMLSIVDNDEQTGFSTSTR
jgi:hypothetical protein